MEAREEFCFSIFCRDQLCGSGQTTWIRIGTQHFCASVLIIQHTASPFKM